MKKSERKGILMLGDKVRKMETLDRKSKETISALERFKNGTFFNSKQK